MKPAHLSFEEAAALPLAGVTAYRALMVRAALQPKEKVLITGIGGGVALAALQFAAAAGAEVFVTSGSDEKLLRAESQGASGGANYKSGQWTETLAKAAGSFDVVIDSAGGSGFKSLVELAAAGGRIAFVGATEGAVKELTLQKIFWKQLSLLGSTMGSPKDFSDMLTFVEAKKIKPVVDKTFLLADAEQAARYMDASSQFGKIVLEIS